MQFIFRRERIQQLIMTSFYSILLIISLHVLETQDGSLGNVLVLTITGLCTCVILGVYVEQVIYVKRHWWAWSIRDHKLCLLAIYPVSTSKRTLIKYNMKYLFGIRIQLLLVG